MAAVTAGILAERFPFVQFGRGEHLIILPGMSLDNEVPGGFVRRSYAWGFRGLAARFRVSIVHRPVGLAGAVSTTELARRYAQVLADFGPAHVVGMSTGGLIAQQLALHSPQAVRSLTLVVAAARLSDSGRATCERWLRLAGAGEWRSLRGEMAVSAVDGRIAQYLARHSVGVFADDPTPVAVTDFTATVGAVLAHDATADLAGITAPTLVLGGTHDVFFDAQQFRDTASTVQGGSVHLYPDSGHGVPKRHGTDLQRRILEFIAASSAGIRQDGSR